MSSNLGDLSHVLSIIDPLRSVMADTMAGREPPTIIVLGAESSGKSTILERMIMLPIFPRQQGLCTRIAIKVHLRRVVGHPALLAQLPILLLGKGCAGHGARVAMVRCTVMEAPCTARRTAPRHARHTWARGAG